MNRFWRLSLRSTFLLGLFMLTQVAYLHRVPGLLGDEASEGENVYQLLRSEKLPIIGERSYIGVLTDYIRVPFFLLFGYSTLAIRMPMLIISIVFFILSGALLQKHLGKTIGTMVLVFLCFSPIYLIYQRVGWAITLVPFFAVLLAYALQSHWKYKWLLSGLIAGVGLQTHILFFPSMIAVCIAMLCIYILHKDWQKRIKELRHSWQILIGFWAGFALQAAVIRFMTDDQGDVSQTTQLFGERLQDLWTSLPLYVSGSSFVAQYTGFEFSPLLIWIICIFLIFCIVTALLFVRKRAVYAVALFAIIQPVILLYMVDRYSLRYFVVLCLAIWLLAGIGFGFLGEKILTAYPRVLTVLPGCIAVGCSIWMIVVVLVPFLRTGGSVQEFSLGNRTSSANAFVDNRSLIDCLRGEGQVFSEREPIQNILLYASHKYSDLVVLDEQHKKGAAYIVSYQERTKNKETLCPNANHFIVQRKR